MTCHCAPDVHPGLTHDEHLALVEFDLRLAELDRLLAHLGSDWTQRELAVTAMQYHLLLLQEIYPPQASERFVHAWSERSARLRDWYTRLCARAHALQAER